MSTKVVYELHANGIGVVTRGYYTQVADADDLKTKADKSDLRDLERAQFSKLEQETRNRGEAIAALDNKIKGFEKQLESKADGSAVKEILSALAFAELKEQMTELFDGQVTTMAQFAEKKITAFKAEREHFQNTSQGLASDLQTLFEQVEKKLSAIHLSLNDIPGITSFIGGAKKSIAQFDLQLNAFRELLAHHKILVEESEQTKKNLAQSSELLRHSRVLFSDLDTQSKVLKQKMVSVTDLIAKNELLHKQLTSKNKKGWFAKLFS